jgi:hypothetical protein
LNPEISKRLLDRVLYWSGGQPYLTQKFCADIVDKHIGDADGVDELVTRSFNNSTRRATISISSKSAPKSAVDEAATIELYAKFCGWAGRTRQHWPMPNSSWDWSSATATANWSLQSYLPASLILAGSRTPGRDALWQNPTLCHRSISRTQ